MTPGDVRDLPIEDYGLLGDTRTAALVSSHGDIDWLCAPRFDSPPVFGRLVGGQDAGTFRAGPVEPAEVLARQYLPHTATLQTAWRVAGGRLILTEGMVAEVSGRLLPATVLVRRLSAEGRAVDGALGVIVPDSRDAAHQRSSSAPSSVSGWRRRYRAEARLLSTSRKACAASSCRSRGRSRM